MTRVLFLTESFHPVLGGGEGHIRGLATSLVAGGWPASVVTRQTDAAWPREEMLDGVRVRRVPPSGTGRAGKYGMVLPAMRALGRAREDYDVLVVRGTRVLGLPGLVAARRHGKAVVLQPEVNGEMTGEVYTWGTALDRPLPRAMVRAAVAARNRLLHDADAVVAMSKAILSEAREAAFAPERVAYIPHGVDTARFRPADASERAALRARLDLPAGARLVVYTGRLLRGKGLETLLDAFAALAGVQADVHLLLVGSGAGQSLSVEDALRERARTEGLEERVTFTGRVDNVDDWLRASDVFAFPSVFEALGLSVIEASACGLPVLACRTGGVVDVVEDGTTGLLVPPGEGPALRSGLEALLADPARRRALGEAGRRRMRERFDAADSLARYRSLFAEVAR